MILFLLWKYYATRVYALLDRTVREYCLSGDGLKELARGIFNGHPIHIAVECERQMLILADAADDNKVQVSVRRGNMWAPFRKLTCSQHQNLNIASWSLMGPNILALHDNKNPGTLKIYEFT